MRRPSASPQAALFAACALALAAPTARASWTADGIPVAPTDTLQSGPVIASDGAGGAYVAWQDWRSGGISIYVQHLTGTGGPAQGWPTLGRGILPGLGDPVIAADGRGGAFVAGARTPSIGYSHIGPTGAASTAWIQSSRGAQPAKIEKEDPSGLPFLLADGIGGAYLSWVQGGWLNHGPVLIHAAPDSGQAPGWPGTVGAGTYGLAPVLCSDDSGGVIVAWQRDVVVATRVTVAASTPPSWGPYGSDVGAGAGSDAPGIVSDGAGGALVFWLDPRLGSARVFAQRITGSSAIAPGWPSGGLQISGGPSEAGTVRYWSSYPIRYTSVATDGAGGAYVAWKDSRSDSGDVYLQHVLPSGAIAPGWPDGGLPVCAAPGTQALPTVASDAAGGVLVSWEDHRSGVEWDVYAQRLGADGTPAPGWPAGGVRVCSAAGDQVLPQICGDGAGGALLAWQDGRCGALQVFASPVGADGVLPTAPGSGAVSVAVASAVADSGTTRIVWRVTQGTLTGSLPNVYCRQVDGDWALVGQAWPDPDGTLSYADAGALQGCRYGYALGVVSCGVEKIMGVVWVDTPAGQGFTTLAATSFAAIPDSGRVRLHWQLRGGEALQGSVSRRDSCSDWTLLWIGVTNEDGILEYSDPGRQFAGHRVEYRLVVHACGADHDLGAFPVDLPAGAGFVPTTSSLVFSRIDTTSVALTWRQTSGPPCSGHVERRDSLSAWSLVADLAPDAGGGFHLLDAGLLPEHRYEYRIGLTNCGVEVLSDPVTVRTASNPDYGLWLRGVFPNPASRALTVDFSLPDASPATLEVIDASGRGWIRRRVESMGPGLHAFVLDDVARLRTGFYVLRLTQRGHSQTRRIAIIH